MVGRGSVLDHSIDHSTDNGIPIGVIDALIGSAELQPDGTAIETSPATD